MANKYHEVINIIVRKILSGGKLNSPSIAADPEEQDGCQAFLH